MATDRFVGPIGTLNWLMLLSKITSAEMGLIGSL
jgi:hypothetical protein